MVFLSSWDLPVRSIVGYIRTPARVSLAGLRPTSPKVFQNIAVAVRVAESLFTQTMYLTA